LLYSTYVGGKSSDEPAGIAVDMEGNAYIAGYSASSDFPMADMGYDKSYNGDGEAIVFKLDQDGSSLIYSTYVGGE